MQVHSFKCDDTLWSKVQKKAERKGITIGELLRNTLEDLVGNTLRSTKGITNQPSKSKPGAKQDDQKLTPVLHKLEDLQRLTKKIIPLTTITIDEEGYVHYKGRSVEINNTILKSLGIDQDRLSADLEIHGEAKYQVNKMIIKSLL